MTEIPCLCYGPPGGPCAMASNCWCCESHPDRPFGSPAPSAEGPGASITQSEIGRRYGQLLTLSKAELAVIWRYRNPDYVGGDVPPERWTKDELAEGIIDREFPNISARVW